MASELYEQIYAVVEQIPSARVATYGQIARILGSCGPRQVGYAMAAAPPGLPWQRVINSRGRVSARADGNECSEQRRLLEGEGVVFGADGRCDLSRHGWEGPDGGWLTRHGIGLEPLL
jgi:methylated-DNA-protein-cysteine methyltransferase-like protein